MMRKFKLILAALALAFSIIGIGATSLPKMRPQQASAAQTGDKDDPPPEPNRPYYDVWGNQFTYDGQLITVGPCPYTDPTSGQPNPYYP